MASDEEEMDTSSISIDTVQTINGLFPIKIDNLEYIPSEILYRIFMQVDNMALLNLADCSYRFECLAKIVFIDKNADEYFVFNEKTEKQHQKYVEFFDRIGCHADINGIEATGVKIRHANHWLPQLIQRHTNQIGKLTLVKCSGEQHILQHHTHITHLVIVNAYARIADLQLQNCRHLVKLELACNIDAKCLKSIIRKNPAMESLILRNPNGIIDGVLIFITGYLHHLKELIIMDYAFKKDWPMFLTYTGVTIDSLKHLESFGLTLENRHTWFIHQLGLECKNLKRLELEYFCRGDGNFHHQMFDAIGQFRSVESLKLTQKKYSSQIESLVEHLINLRHLHLSLGSPIPRSTTFIISLLLRCPSLETITIDLFTDRIPNCFMSVEFFDEFNAIMQNPHGKIQFRNGTCDIAHVTKKEIVLQGLRLHWFQYDWSYNSSNINLLDLAKPSTPGSIKERNPFECILEYLDLGSLCSLAASNEQSKQLVESYVQQHAQRNGTFTLTDRFKSNGQFQFIGNELVTFAEYVINMRLTLVRHTFPVYLNRITGHFRNLDKLWIFSVEGLVNFPQVRHLVIEHNAIDLHTCAQCFPNIEVLEIKTTCVPLKKAVEERLQFCNLKKIIFKYNDEAQMEIFRELFKNTQTQLIPEFTLDGGKPCIDIVKPVPMDIGQ